MRTLAIASMFGSLVALGACGKGKPSYKPPAPSAVEQPHATAGSATANRTKLVLPALSGKPPAKSTKPIDNAVIGELVKKTFPGFQIDVRARGDDGVEIRQRTEDHPVILATITLTRCQNDCQPMDLAKWQADTKTTKQFLPEALQKLPDTVFQVGSTSVFGQPMIYTYQLGQGPGAQGGVTFTDAYVLYYNDGVNQARVIAEYKDDLTRSKDAMAHLAPESDLAKVAMTFMDAYTQAW